METTTDGACPPISRAREGAGAVRLDGPTGRVDRLVEPAWRRVHPLPALGMASVQPLQGRRHAARHRARKADSPANQPGIDAPRQDMAYPRASLERGARERVERGRCGAVSRSVRGCGGRACRTPLRSGSQHTLRGHTSRVPGRGWRGAVPPLTPPTATAMKGGTHVWVKIRARDAERAGTRRRAPQG